MDLPQMSISASQILVGVLSAVITLAGSFWIYRRSKRDAEIRWRIENVYEEGLDEVNAVIEDNDFPGSLRNRQDSSFWDDVGYVEQLRLGPCLIRKATKYYRLLEDLERAERRFVPLNQEITEKFPDDVIRIEGTEVQILVGGIADPPVSESHGDNPPEALLLSSWAGLGLVFQGQDTAILDVDSPQELRDYLLPDEGVEEYPYPDEPTIFYGGGVRPENLSFLEEEFPEWAECLYEVVEEGYLEEYLEAHKQEHQVKKQLKDAAREVRETIREDIASLNEE